MTPGGCSGSALQSSLFRNNGRAREAKPLFSQHLHSLSDRWALRINSLYVCWPSAEPAASACSWPPWLLSTPWLPRQSLESPSLRQSFNRLLFLLLRDSQGCWGACYFGKSATFRNALSPLLSDRFIWQCLISGLFVTLWRKELFVNPTWKPDHLRAMTKWVYVLKGHLSLLNILSYIISWSLCFYCFDLKKKSFLNVRAGNWEMTELFMVPVSSWTASVTNVINMC